MRFYAVSEADKEAIEITECTDIVAEQIGDELRDAVGELWCIKDTDLQTTDDYDLVQNIHSKNETYEMVKRLGHVYEVAESEEDEIAETNAEGDAKGNEPDESSTTSTGGANFELDDFSDLADVPLFD
jgi:hypothetical protein